MIGLDTNVLVRAILQDEPVQSAKAWAPMAAEAQRQDIFVSSFAVVELAKEIVAYEVPHEKVVETLRTLLMTLGITIGSRHQVAAALSAY